VPISEQIKAKIERIKNYVKILYQLKDECLEKFLTDPVYRGALMHYLYLSADSCISLAEMIIRDRGFQTPQSYTEAIDILGENNIIPPDFAYEFSKVASFRNFLAHDYEKVDHFIICTEALEKLPDIEKFLHYIEEKGDYALGGDF
jgi:uncharacterized protein YutE (UPF0331/DUF86 family)